MILVLIDSDDGPRYNILNRTAGRVSALHPLWQITRLRGNRSTFQGQTATPYFSD